MARWQKNKNYQRRLLKDTEVHLAVFTSSKSCRENGFTNILMDQHFLRAPYANYVNYSTKEEHNYFTICHLWPVKSSIEHLTSHSCFELNSLDYYVSAFDARFVTSLSFDDVSGLRPSSSLDKPNARLMPTQLPFACAGSRTR